MSSKAKPREQGILALASYGQFPVMFHSKAHKINASHVLALVIGARHNFFVLY